MELLEAIANRRSIRNYKNQAVPKGTAEKLLEAARLAPSAGNVQPWEFIIATKPETKKALMRGAYGQKFLEQASLVIVVCVDEKKAEKSYGVRGRTLYCYQDTGAAIQNILLTAYSLGLGTCWIGAFNEEEIRKVINCPQEMRPVALIPVGYPDETPRTRLRRSVFEIMHHETF